jgi:TRAP transporter TAXI family solute receptor
VRGARLLAIVLEVASLLSAATALGQNVIPDSEAARDALAAEIDRQRIGIVTGGPGGTYIQLGSDLSRLVESATEGAVRVIVMEGRGSVGNLQDLVFLKYTDLALVQADVLAWIERNHPDDYAFLTEYLRFVARFHPEIIHVLVRGGPVDGPAALAGKRIAIGAPGSGTNITAPIVFDLLGFEAEYVPLHQDAALADLLSEAPTVDAMVYVAGRGSPLFTRLTPEMARLVEDKQIYFVPFPEPPPAESSYVAVSISSADYPSFIEQGTEVSAWSVPAVLAVYNWDPRLSNKHVDRHRRLVTFINAFFDNRKKLNDGPGGFNENWCSIDLANDVGGWTRFSPAQDWLDRNSATAICEDQTRMACRDTFAVEMREAGLDPSNSAVAALFDDWRKQNGSACR